MTPPSLALARLTSAALLAGVVTPLAAGTAPSWTKQTLSKEFYAEGGTFADLNRDGVPDVIAGPYWFEGPDFGKRHELYPPKVFDPLKYSDNFFAFADDFNGDGWTDILVVVFPGEDASWLENPGAASGPWKRHTVLRPVDNESPTYAALLPGGQRALLCMNNGRLGYALPKANDPTAPWEFHAVSPAMGFQKFTHGLGVGDVNGDGRLDLLAGKGWWEQPASLEGDPEWKHHPAAFGMGAQMYVTDVNGDGLPDVITALAAHGFGLSWFEQKRQPDGTTTFVPHEILSADAAKTINDVQFSELHALALTDVDGDKLPDIVTGKRWWAHGPSGDPGAAGKPVVYAFLLRRSAEAGVSFKPLLLDDDSGVGTQFVAQDINRDGLPDFLSVNKHGIAVLLSSPAQP